MGGIGSAEATAIGIADGWDAANYADAYGSQESPEEEAHRRARERYSTAVIRQFYEDAFLLGWERFDNDLWQDGTPRGDES